MSRADLGSRGAQNPHTGTERRGEVAVLWRFLAPSRRLAPCRHDQRQVLDRFDDHRTVLGAQASRLLAVVDADLDQLVAAEAPALLSLLHEEHDRVVDQL
eukprot:752011-Prymnesium_polylepis.1